MATRDTRLVIKNRQSAGGVFPSGGNALLGEAVVNLSDGILAFSGISGGAFTTNDNGTGGYFEVGSNLYDLAIRNKITRYENTTSLAGKFLSGTSTGFVLADISEIDGNFDSFTFSGDSGTVETIDSGENILFAGGTGIDSVSSAANTVTFSIDSTVAQSSDTLAFFAATTSAQLAGVISDETGSGSLVFGSSPTLDSPTINTLIGGDITSGGNITPTNYLVGATATQTLTNKTIDVSNNTVSNIFTFSGDSGTVETIDGGENIKIVGGTNITTTSSVDNTITIATTGVMNSFTVAGDSGGGQTIENSNTLTIAGGTGIDTVDSATDTVTVSIDATVATSASTLDFFSPTTSAELAGVISDETGSGALVFGTSPTISTSLVTDFLGTNRLVYTNGSQGLTSDANSTFDGTNMSLSTTSSLTLGTGGLTVGSGGSPGTPGNGDVTIHGSLIVFGDAITASTGQLYVEDNTIEINYNPDSATNATSLGSGFLVQDGDGAGVDLTFKVGELNTLDGTEYPVTTGAANRAFYTNLNDIMIRQTTDTTSPTTGKRVLAEDDVLDGGTY